MPDVRMVTGIAICDCGTMFSFDRPAAQANHVRCPRCYVGPGRFGIVTGLTFMRDVRTKVAFPKEER